MARVSASSGLGIGQVLTLTFGFLAASVLIFALGWWVGYDAAEQRISHEEQVVRLPVQLPTRGPEASPGARVAAVTKPPMAVVATATSARVAVAATATPVSVRPTATHSTVPGPTKAVASGRWTVQVSATTDPLQAVMLARKLRSKGYDAFTVQGPIGGLMWYRVRVGRYADKAAAQGAERRLKQEEGLEAAFVSASDQ